MKKTTILTIALFICGILTGLMGAFSIGKDVELYHLKTETIEQSEMIDSLKAANDTLSLYLEASEECVDMLIAEKNKNRY